MAQYTFPKDMTAPPIITQVLEKVYPVGIVIVTEDDTNPEDLGLPGTWEEVE